ncbi:DMT family transporter [Novosphingobium sp. FKTRR1]|uniref:DMT family transporter n=1 Tax=Novosphingobium sp. FKTRR1 TaxID=2879118 RepID=UPI001CF0C674|nr:DMT family transporter [Novosphingobium sp. FKTRR1]
MTTAPQVRKTSRPHTSHLLALLGGNLALSVGPTFVRMADSGPVSAAFWRVILALPLLALLARFNRQRLTGIAWKPLAAVVLAGMLFSLDLASWHIGIERTKLGNASLFGNSTSLMLMVWGVIMARRWPRMTETAAIALALAGSAVLMGRSLEIGAKTLAGDLFCVLAGLFYFFFLLLIQRARGAMGPWAQLFHSSWASAPILVIVALAMGEPFWPHVWWPLLALALGSQVIGTGLLFYALGRFSSLVVGLGLLSQPAVATLLGWLAFGERIGWLDAAGMVCVGAALVLAVAGEGRAAKS